MAKPKNSLVYLASALALSIVLGSELACSRQPLPPDAQPSPASQSQTEENKGEDEPRAFVGTLHYTSTSPLGSEEDLGTVSVSDDLVSWSYPDSSVICYSIQKKEVIEDSWVYSLQSCDSDGETAQLSIPANLGEKDMRGTLGTCFLSKAEHAEESSIRGTMTQSLYDFEAGEFSKSTSFLKVMGNASESSAEAFLGMNADALVANDLYVFANDVGCNVDKTTVKGTWSVNGSTLELRFSPETGRQDGGIFTTTIEIVRK